MSSDVKPTSDVKTEVRKEVISQLTKWAIASFAALVSLAAIGWWLYLEPKIRIYIIDAAGGVPKDAVIASTTECSKLAGKWDIFEEGTSRFLIGAGNKINEGYSNWLPEGGTPVPLTKYTVNKWGGEEKHLIKSNEMPTLITSVRNDLATRPTGMITMNSAQMNFDPKSYNSFNIMPPYIAVYFCKKL